MGKPTHVGFWAIVLKKPKMPRQQNSRKSKLIAEKVWALAYETDPVVKMLGETMAGIAEEFTTWKYHHLMATLRTIGNRTADFSTSSVSWLLPTLEEIPFSELLSARTFIGDPPPACPHTKSREYAVQAGAHFASIVWRTRGDGSVRGADDLISSALSASRAHSSPAGAGPIASSLCRELIYDRHKLRGGSAFGAGVAQPAARSPTSQNAKRTSTTESSG